MTTNQLFECDVMLEKAHEACRAGHYEQATTLYADALHRREDLIGEDLVTGEIMDHLGLMAVKLNKTKDAEDWFKKSVDAVERATYALHYKLAPVLEHLTDLYVRQEKYEEAETTGKRALDIYDKTLNSEHRSIFEMSYKLILIYRHLKNYAEAEKLITKALKNLDTPLGPAEEFRYQQALIYLNQDKNAEAEAALKQACDGFEMRHHFPRLYEALGYYAEALGRNGKKEEAEETRQYRERVHLATRHFKQHSDDIFPATLLRA